MWGIFDVPPLTYMSSPAPDLVLPAPVHSASLLEKIRHLFPAGQFLRYLCVGVWNTVFGYGTYAAFVALYSRFLPHHYLPLTVDLATISAGPISITMSYLCYKF